MIICEIVGIFYRVLTIKHLKLMFSFQVSLKAVHFTDSMLAVCGHVV